MSKRILSLLLTALMVISMFPSAAFAAEGGIVEEPAAAEELQEEIQEVTKEELTGEIQKVTKEEITGEVQEEPSPESEPAEQPEETQEEQSAAEESILESEIEPEEIMPVLALATEGTAITNSSFASGSLTISTGGSYYLSENVTGKITIKSGINVTLDLNGYVLKGPGSGSVITPSLTAN